MHPLRLPCYCGSLRQATRAVTQLYERHLSPCGLTISQFGILKLLDAAPSLTVGDIAAAMVMDSTTVSRTVVGLSKRGWIAMARGYDRRQKPWGLLPAGRDKLTEAAPHWEEAQRQLERQASGLDLQTLLDGSFALVKALEDAHPPGPA